MKHLLCAACLGLTTVACTTKNHDFPIAIADSTYTIEHVLRIADRNGAHADRILDSLERREYLADYTSIPDYKLQFARAYVASRQLRPNLAISHLLRTLKNPEAVRDTTAYTRALELISGEYCVLGRYDDCLDSYSAIMAAAEASGNRSLHNRALLNTSIIHAQGGDFPAAIASIRAARDGMTRQSYQDNFQNIITTYELEASYLSHSGNTHQAIRQLQQALRAYNQLTPEQRAGTVYEPDEDLNFRKAHIHITLATLFAKEHRPDSSAHHYKAWRAAIPNGLQPVISSEFYDLAMLYYMTTKQYDKALSYSHAYNNAFGSNENDTVTMFNVVLNSNLSEIYAAKGDYRNALKYLQIAGKLSDDLNNRSNNALNAEMEAIYDDIERRQQIARQSADINAQRIYIAYLLAVTLLALGLGTLAWRNYKRARNKNRTLISQIKELYNVRQMINPATTPLVAKRNSDSPHSGLCERLDHAIQQDKLYLQPSITRQSVAATLSTNTTYLSRAIRESYNMTFSEYLTWIRLEHAKQTLLSDNETKIEAIAMESGFNSVRTFYRLFREKYGVTPNEYRTIITTNK